MNLVNNRYKFSLFENIYKVENPTENIDINQLIEITKYGYLKDTINKLRATKDKETANNIKMSELPCVTLSGIFNHRNNKGLIKHSGLMQIDLDDVKNYNSLFKQICDDSYTYVCFRSPRGNGIKVIVKINPDVSTHLEQFYALERYYKEECSIDIDKACKDVSRAMLLSYDKDIYCNPHSDVYEELYMPEPEVEKPKSETPQVKEVQTSYVSYSSDDHETINSIIRELESRRIDITDSYENWIKVGFAIVNSFGEGGREYFHRISALYPDYSRAECDRQYDNLVTRNSGGISFGTLVYFAKQNGVEIKSRKTVKPKEKAIPQPSASSDERLKNALRKERIRLAYEIGKPAFYVFSNKVLEEIIYLKPRTIKELKKVSGIGKQKIEWFGAKIVSIINEY